MTDTTDREIAYLSLGRLIAGQSPRGFEKASLGMEQFEGQTRLWLLATMPGQAEEIVQIEPLMGQAILESLRLIRQQMAEEEGRSWQSCVVTLGAGGKFALDATY